MNKILFLFLFIILFFSSCDLIDTNTNDNNNNYNSKSPLNIDISSTNYYNSNLLIYNNIDNYITIDITNSKLRNPKYTTFEFFGYDFGTDKDNDKLVLDTTQFNIQNEEIETINGYETLFSKDIILRTNLNDNSQKKITIPYRYSFNYETTNIFNVCFSNTINFNSNCFNKNEIISSQSPLEFKNIQVNKNYNDNEKFTTKLLIEIEKPSNKIISDLKTSYKSLDLSDETTNSFIIEFIDVNNIEIMCQSYKGTQIEPIETNKFKIEYYDSLEELNLLCSFTKKIDSETITLPIKTKATYVYYHTNTMNLFVNQ